MPGQPVVEAHRSDFFFGKTTRSCPGHEIIRAALLTTRFSQLLLSHQARDGPPERPPARASLQPLLFAFLVFGSDRHHSVILITDRGIHCVEKIATLHEGLYAANVVRNASFQKFGLVGFQLVQHIPGLGETTLPLSQCPSRVALTVTQVGKNYTES